MKILSKFEINQVSGAIVSTSGGYSSWLGNITFGSNFQMIVTGGSSSTLNNVEFLSDKVIDHATGKILFDGTQKTFCMNGSQFSATPVTDYWYVLGSGHSYNYVGACS